MGLFRWGRVWGAIALTMAVVLLGAGPTWAELDVYKVDRVVYERDYIQPGEPLGFGKPLAQIEIAEVELADKVDESVDPFAEWEFRERVDSMLLVGSEGVSADARVFTRELRCVYLCGDGGGESCRDTGLIDWHSQPIGEPLLAIAGLSGEITDFVSYGDAKPTEEIPELDSDRATLLSPPSTSVSMSTQGDDLKLAVESYGNPLDLLPNQCTWTDYGESGLGSLTCQWEAVLMHRGQPLLLSYADYNVAQAGVVSRFTVSEQVYYTVVLGQKGYTAYGLLFETSDGWQVIFSAKDWPTLC